MNNDDWLQDATEALLMEMVPTRLAASLSDDVAEELYDSVYTDLSLYTLEDARSYLKERVAIMLDNLQVS
jgi:CO dehydrogenase/acetyl-CoA synthase beta subunit